MFGYYIKISMKTYTLVDVINYYTGTRCLVRSCCRCLLTRGRSCKSNLDLDRPNKNTLTWICSGISLFIWNRARHVWTTLKWAPSRAATGDGARRRACPELCARHFVSACYLSSDVVGSGLSLTINDNRSPSVCLSIWPTDIRTNNECIVWERR